jgi:hypothetical protein
LKRKVEQIDTSKLKDDFPELRDSKVRIFLDAENSRDKQRIETLLQSAGRKKLNTIFGCILRCNYLNKIYKREAKGVTTIKFKGGKSKNQNVRIYCKEFHNNGRVVVLVTPFVKKVSKNVESEKILHIIEKITNLEY